MKHKILTLLLLVFVLCASSGIAVHAEEETSVTLETTDVEVNETIEVEETEQETKTDTKEKVHKTIKANKKVKVNKNVKLKKVLGLSKKEVKNYDFSINKDTVASVSKAGIVTGVKAGKTLISVTSKEDDSVYAEVTLTVKNRFTEKNLRLLASLIYCEARGESYAGQKAVGIVTTNRVSSALFPNSLSGVVYQAGQYTPARSGALASALKKYDNGTLQKSCIKAATETLNGDKTVSLSSGDKDMSRYLFFSRYLLGSRLQIGAHQFK